MQRRKKHDPPVLKRSKKGRAYAYVKAPGHYARAAKSASKLEATGSDPRKLLNGAMYQLLRGSGNASSVLNGHSLLEDLYGRDGVSGNIVGAQLEVGGQFVGLDFASSPGEPFGTFAGFHSGAVLTMVSGPARGTSTRVTGYSPSEYA